MPLCQVVFYKDVELMDRKVNVLLIINKSENKNDDHHFF